MKILVNCLSSVSGGAVSYLRNLIPKLIGLFEQSDEGHQVKILCHENQKQLFPTISDSHFIIITDAYKSGYHRVLWEYSHLSSVLHKERVNVLFIPYQIGPKITGVKQVLMLRNMEPFLFHRYRYSLKMLLRNRFLNLLSSYSLTRADRIIAVSKFAKGYAVNSLNISEKQIRMIYHGRDENFTPEEDSLSDKKILESIGLHGNFLLTCGSLLPYRRVEDVISAFIQLASPNLKLVIAGSGTDEKYNQIVKELITKSGVSEHILAPGHVSQKTMQALYRHCRACIIATEIEACPNIAIEAMASGCVIISSDSSPLPEIFANCSLEYPARNIDVLKFQLQQGLYNEDVRHRLKSQAIERAKFFSWKKCAEQTYSALTYWE